MRTPFAFQYSNCKIIHFCNYFLFHLIHLTFCCAFSHLSCILSPLIFVVNLFFTTKLCFYLDCFNKLVYTSK
nr:MAG TPA: hypothetical protein [Caudoviricetes sp.]